MAKKKFKQTIRFPMKKYGSSSSTFRNTALHLSFCVEGVKEWFVIGNDKQFDVVATVKPHPEAYEARFDSWGILKFWDEVAGVWRCVGLMSGTESHARIMAAEQLGLKIGTPFYVRVERY